MIQLANLSSQGAGKNPVKIIALILACLLLLSSISCEEPLTELAGEAAQKYDKAFLYGGKAPVFSIVSGSENEILEPVLEKFAQKQRINLSINYQGSLDIMRLLAAETIAFDAIWPASSLWISVGDTQHRVKHLASTSLTPVIFGIRDSLAEQLGFKEGPVTVADILESIAADKLKFTMTSATHSNSGASAYIAFLYALLGNPSALQEEDLQQAELQEKIRTLLAGVERSSGSSNWLCELYLEGNYDAMVNYEALIISTNQELERQGRETMYAVYPEDGLSLADSPIGFVADNGVAGRDQAQMEKLFLDLQEYLLSTEVQKKILATGRRSSQKSLKADDAQVFRPTWGIDTERTLSTKHMPQRDVLLSALQLYQSEFKKPAYNIFLLDFSGSMAGRGQQELLEALSHIMLEEKAREDFLQASSQEINSFYQFHSSTEKIGQAQGGGDDLALLYARIEKLRANGGTALYSSVLEALAELKSVDLETYNPAIILMTDGARTRGIDYYSLKQTYEEAELDVPIFSILFGEAKTSELEPLAKLSRARVFDGRENLLEAFRTVRGYN